MEVQTVFSYYATKSDSDKWSKCKCLFVLFFLIAIGMGFIGYAIYYIFDTK